MTEKAIAAELKKKNTARAKEIVVNLKKNTAKSGNDSSVDATENVKKVISLAFQSNIACKATILAS